MKNSSTNNSKAAQTTTAKVAQTVQTAKQQRHEGPEGGAPTGDFYINWL